MFDLRAKSTLGVYPSFDTLPLIHSIDQGSTAITSADSAEDKTDETSEESASGSGSGSDTVMEKLNEIVNDNEKVSGYTLFI